MQDAVMSQHSGHERDPQRKPEGTRTPRIRSAERNFAHQLHWLIRQVRGSR